MTPDNARTVRYFGPPSPDEDTGFTAEEKAILDFTNRKVAAGETLKEIMDFFFRETRSIMPCDRIGVALLEEDNSRLVLYHVLADYEPLRLPEGYTADVKGGSLAPVLGDGSPRVINDLEEYYRLHPDSESTRLLVEEGVRSSMTCPLLVEGRVAGVMFRSSREKNAYGEKEIRLHRAMVERLSQAVEKAWRIEQLGRAFNSYMEMLGFVAHEMKSPLSSIVTMGQTLLGGYYGPMDEKPKEMVARMIQRAEHLIGLSGEYLNLSRVETGAFSLNIQESDMVDEVIVPALEVVAPQIESNHVRLEKDLPTGLPPVRCDPELMRIVFVNLLSNAVKYGIVRGRVKISASAAGGVMTLKVWNQGPGFPESEKKHLFKKFSRLQTAELKGRKGSGIGLYMSWKTVTAHGGTIRAASEEGQWAEFTVELPVGGPGS